MACSSGDQKGVQHKIFLSHAGKEKDFVEQLWEDLENIYPGRIFFDKDPLSLPHGESFPNHILEAAQKCEVAVIVISESYFERKWPMIELAEFVSSQSQFPKKIVPLFYKLSVEEFKDPKRQDRWFEEWENLKDSRIDEKMLETWKGALRSIYPLNGIKMNGGESEVSYRKRIIRAICNVVSPVIEFDVSHVVGKDRICSFIREKLEPFDENCPPRFFGMYAMGGMGKTTMSRVMCNELSSQFLAKVCHVELNNHAIIDLRKKLLRTLTKWDEIDMSKLTDESQVHSLLKEHVSRHRLFLVVDNVWDQQDSIKEARSFLSLPFKEGSVVLVTARSSNILVLLEKIPWPNCFSTPFLDIDAATNLFVNAVGDKTFSELDLNKQTLTKTFVRSCYFSRPGSFLGEEYHPLALEVLGRYVGLYPGRWEDIKVDFKSVGENEQRDPLFSVLEIGWEGLSKKCRSLFLDVVHFLETRLSARDYREDDEFPKWYCAIYNEENANVCHWLEILNRRAILNINYEWGGVLKVHDLYREFATRQFNKLTHSGHCILHGRGPNEHYQRERLTIRRSNIISLTKQGLCKCSTKVQVLRVVQCDHLKKVNLRGMKDLRSIEIFKCQSLEEVILEDLRNLVWLDMDIYNFIPERTHMLPSMKGLVSLQVLRLCIASYPWSSILMPCSLLGLLQDCTSLLELEIDGYPFLLEFPDLSNSKKLMRFIGVGCDQTKRLPCLSNFEELRHLELEKVGVTDIHGLDSLKKLETLKIVACDHLKTIPNLAKMGSTLRTISVALCNVLELVPSLGKLSCLEALELSYCRKVQEIHGVEKLQNLKSLNCSWTRIAYLPDISMLTNLARLHVSNTPIYRIGGLPKNLEHFHMGDCAHVKELSTLGQLSRLRELNLSSCKEIQEIHVVVQLQSLTYLSCSRTSIGYLPDISMLTNLAWLDVSNTLIYQIGGLPKNLEHFVMRDCAHVKDLSTLGQLSRLRELNLSGCKEIQEIHVVVQLQSLTYLSCSGTSIGYLPDISMLTNLAWLNVSNTLIYQIGGLPKNLEHFVMRDCAHVKDLSTLGQLSRLRELNLSGCKEIQEIHVVVQLQSLTYLSCSGTSIGYLPDISMLTNLAWLNVSNTLIYQITGLPKNLKDLDMSNCAHVKELSTLGQLSRLRELNLSGCKEIQEIHVVVQLQSLSNLDCSGTNIGYLPDISMLTNLARLDVSNTPIYQIGGLPKSLMRLSMAKCPNVEKLPNLSELDNLQELNLYGCKQVREIHGVDQLQNLTNFYCGGTGLRNLLDLSMLTRLIDDPWKEPPFYM